MTAPTLPQVADLLDTLRRMGLGAMYPPELRTPRRAQFIASIPDRDPADCSDIKTEPVSEEADARNSRPLPY
jgi:hypothetical protein